MKFKIYMSSLGCSKNLVDSEQMLYLLTESGYELINDPAEADAIIVNTCAFIDDAKQESINEILGLARYKDSGRCTALAVTGCLAQRFQAEVMEELPEVDAVVGVNSIGDICEIIDRCLSGEKLLWIGAESEHMLGKRLLCTPTHMAYLKIAEGCSNNCTYCAIPSIRGAYRSFPMDKIVEQAAEIAEKGVKELSVVAQDVTRYGQDLNCGYQLPELMSELLRLPFKWVRLHYCYPDVVTDRLLELYDTHKNLCAYIDLPIQHISDGVLKRMGRRIDSKGIYGLIDKIRNRDRYIAIRTSLIVGFPGETEQEFLELLDFVKSGVLDKIGVFKYSQEEGTPAARMPAQIDDEVKQQRFDEIMRVHADVSYEKNQRYVGKIITVLVEEQLSSTQYLARSEYDATEIDHSVHISSGTPLAVGEFVEVEIESAQAYDFVGRLV